MKIVLPLVIFCILTLASNLAVAQDNSTLKALKVLSLNFNSENFLNDSDYHVRDLRFAALKKWVKDNDPDIIMLEEAWKYRKDRSVAIAFARAIGYDINYRIEMGFFTFFTEANAVLAKKNLKMSTRYAYKLPHSAADLGDGKTWDIQLGAVSYAVGAKLKMANGEPLYAFATHLTGTNESDRADQAAAVLAHAKDIAKQDGIPWEKAHFIVSGDFNSFSEEPAIQAMRNEGFLDTYAEAHPGDTSCSLCEVPALSWFNPFSIAPGLYPSQNGESTEGRIDYIFSHGPHLKPATSTLTFTAPLGGVWMSDHYGVTTVFSESADSNLKNPTHDSEDTIPATVVQTISKSMMSCGYEGICSDTLKPMIVNGSRGIVIENRSDIKFYIKIKGPGFVFSKTSAWLKPGEQAAFTFATVGDYSYSVTGVADILNQGIAVLKGAIHVQNSGY
jgi:endonuclease/exonuclease/phosphatase family metal-dependent hydrolase